MNLVIDIGNTAIKIGLFSENELLEKQHIATVEELKHLINVRKPTNVIASSTAAEMFSGGDWDNFAVHKVLHTFKFPFELVYKTPETLGTDRLCAVAGAQGLFQDENILIINMGTCITYDFLSSDGIYSGGAISPGVTMRFNAMHKFTARLPKMRIPEGFPNLIGDSTKSCMESGVMNGVRFEMEGAVKAYLEKYGEIKVVLTGGDAKVFEKKFKEPIFAAPDLVLIGLNVILQYNVASL